MADHTPTTDPQLDLATLISRPFVLIDGERHELLNPDECTVLALNRLNAWGAQMTALEQLAEPSEEDDQAYGQLADRFCRAVLQAPAEVHSRLSVAQRVRVVSTFLELWLKPIADAARAMEATQAPADAGGSTGAS